MSEYLGYYPDCDYHDISYLGYYPDCDYHDISCCNDYLNAAFGLCGQWAVLVDVYI